MGKIKKKKKLFIEFDILQRHHLHRQRPNTSLPRNNSSIIYRRRTEAPLGGIVLSYILDLISSHSALSLSMSPVVDGQLMPSPSVSLGLGICILWLVLRSD